METVAPVCRNTTRRIKICCCRVTPRGFPPVQGPTATKAWQALYASDEDGAARSLNLSGEAFAGRS